MNEEEIIKVKQEYTLTLNEEDLMDTPFAAIQKAVEYGIKYALSKQPSYVSKEPVNSQIIQEAAKQWAMLNYAPMTPNKDSDYIISVAANSYEQGYKAALSLPLEPVKGVDIDILSGEIVRICYDTPKLFDACELIKSKLSPHLTPPLDQQSEAIELLKIRNNLYDNIPSGKIEAFMLIRIIQEHLKELDEFIDKSTDIKKH